DYDANDLQCKDNSNSQYKVCNGFFSYNYAVLAKYGTKGKNHQILQNDALFDGNEKAEGYFKHDNCMEKTCSQFCSQCASLASNEAFNKRNRPILPGIPPLVLAIIPLNQKETKSDVFFENNTILKELIKLNAKPIGLYFDDNSYDDNINDNINDNSYDQINQMLLQHQHHITVRNNLPNYLDQLIFENDNKLEQSIADNSFFDIINRKVQQNNEIDCLFIMQQMEITH
ncbi:16269_t:CDS:2, partial [Funneliformis geosporum]